RVPRPVREGRVEAVAALPAVLPVVDGRSRHGTKARHAGGDVALPRLLDALLALRRARIGAARADDLPRLPAARQVVGGRLRATPGAARVTDPRLPRTVLLRVPVSGVDLEQPLPVGVVLRAHELLVEAAAGGSVEAPGRSVRNDERREAPLPELLEELGGCERDLVTVGGGAPGVDARGADRHRQELLRQATQGGGAVTGREIEAPETRTLP